MHAPPNEQIIHVTLAHIPGTHRPSPRSNDNIPHACSCPTYQFHEPTTTKHIHVFPCPPVLADHQQQFRCIVLLILQVSAVQQQQIVHLATPRIAANQGKNLFKSIQCPHGLRQTYKPFELRRHPTVSAVGAATVIQASSGSSSSNLYLHDLSLDLSLLSITDHRARWSSVRDRCDISLRCPASVGVSVLDLRVQQPRKS